MQPAKAFVSTIEFTAGVPEVVTVNEPAVPCVNESLLALVIVGGLPTVKVKV